MKKTIALLVLFLVGIWVMQPATGETTSEPLIRAEVFGTVATGTIYTTLVNQNAFLDHLPKTQPAVVELSPAGEVLKYETSEINAIDYQKHPGDTFTLGRFPTDKKIKTGYYELWSNSGNTTPKRLMVTDNENTDVHGLLRTSRNTYVLPSYKLHNIDGQSIQSCVIEEQRLDGEILFTWDSLNHIPLDHSSTTEKRPYWIDNNINDYFHCNSIAEANDGHYLVSARHTNQIVKINRETGDVMWILGGLASDFAFVDDPYNGFSHQHSVTHLPNGNILLYDNGNQHNTPVTRVVEYKLDLENMTAQLVWSYSDGRLTYATGSVQRLPNGHTLVGWGLEPTGIASTSPRITEITPEGEVVMHVYFPDNAGFYNAFKL